MIFRAKSKREIHKLYLCILTIGFLFFIFFENAEATQNCNTAVGKFVSIQGAIQLEHANGGEWLPATLDSLLCQKDTIHVGENSRAAVSLINDVVLRLDQNTTMQLADVVQEPEKRSLLNLITGAFKSFSRPPRFLAVNTPYVNGLIEGTEFSMRVGADSTLVTVYEGKVRTRNDKGQLLLTRGNSAIAKAGKAPEPFILVKPRNAVQWTLYFPPLLAALGGGGGQSLASLPPTLRNALDLASKGDAPDALRLLKQVPLSEQNADYHIYRAAIYLNVGRVAEASADIDAALAKDPKAGLAYSQRAIVEIVNNEQQKALADAEKGAALSTSSAAKIALSYAQQSLFQLKDARNTLLSDVKEHPDDPLAWARLGELWQMLDEPGKAMEAAYRAVAMAPDLARAQLVLGFVALADWNNTEAINAFNKAVALDSSDPLARLGLGLGIISSGHLHDGRRELEDAVALDSSDALLRSYLGKAYFEERRYPLDVQQYDIAKSLDPNDPTAYFYDAISEQLVNRPIVALHDFQTAMKLNDNRAVYRSKLDLDRDRAARGASTGRVYNTLGFQRQGIIIASRSLLVDPANTSAHRFLSDIYRGVRRHEIARVSELYQAQMLQDVNINPVQPSLSETNINIVSAGGPAQAGFNEFTPLFKRNEAQLNATGLFGSNNTFGGEGVLSAVYNKLSLSGGAMHYSTDGWRPNNGINHDIYNVFGQAAVRPDLNVQFELTRHNAQIGDIHFNFDPNSFSNSLTRYLNQDIGRVGMRYSPSPNSDLLFSVAYSDRKEWQGQNFLPVPVFLNQGVRDLGYVGEGQYIFRKERFNLTTGVSVGEVSRTNNASVGLIGMSPFSSLVTPQSISHPRGYLYSNINFPSPAIWTLGFSYDDYQLDNLKVTAFNPKFGLQWYATKRLLLRGAVLRTVKPVLINNRTLEPTEVAGFNQFYDDTNGTQAWKYAVGANWQYTDDLIIGSEGTWRDLSVPVQDFTNQWAMEGQKEQNHRLYVYWTPHPEWSANMEFDYDRFSSGRGLLTDNTNVPEDLQTFSVPLNLRFFHPSGFFAGAGMNYVNQHVVRSPVSTYAQGNSNFVTVDLAAGYRLPKRYGILSLQVTNLLDKQFYYQDDSFRQFGNQYLTGPYFPGRLFMGRFTLNI